MRPYRSLIFVPGHKRDWVAKAVDSGADCVVLDLEDSVPDDHKDEARDTVAASIAAVREVNETVGLFVRVNPLHTRRTGSDLEAVVQSGLDGVFAPKIETASDVHRLDALVDHVEYRAGITGTEYIVPVETVPAIWNCREIASASPRVAAMVGPTAEHADIAREVGFEWTLEGDETLYLRSRVLLACREAGIHALTALWERIDDLEGLETFARSSRRLGFAGMIAIHPSHVGVVNSVFSPSAEDIAFYRGLVDAYEQGAASGEGAVRYGRLHVDRAHYDKALEWLRRHVPEAP